MHIEIKRNKVRVDAVHRITGKRMNEKWVREVLRRELVKKDYTDFEVWLRDSKSWGYIYTIEHAPKVII